MSRPSTMYADQPHPTRSSLFPGAGPGSSSSTSGSGASTSRLQAKQQELEGLKELREYSARLVRELETMGQGLEAIKKGEESEYGRLALARRGQERRGEARVITTLLRETSSSGS